MQSLPSEFLSRMQKLLGEAYAAFVECYAVPALKGVRLNPLKCTAATLREYLPFSLAPAPFSPLSYYIDAAEKVGALPLHHAGAFYAQEPSAASAVTVLAPQAGNKVLDLCAAPGGKATQIASLLDGTGLIWANEVVRSRANILLSNMERLGVRNGIVSSCHPAVLCEKLAGFFDKVLVDAPCSGEGMFGRDPQAVVDWSVAHVQTCAMRQAAILDCAAQAVKTDGVLVYSTCTFAKEENEDTVLAFLQRHPEFVLEDCGVSFGRPGIGLPQTRRIYPMDGGAGHFVAKLRRVKENLCTVAPFALPKRQNIDPAHALLEELMQIPWEGKILRLEQNFFLLPEELPVFQGLGVLRAGILLGEQRQNRVEPAHALFMAARPQDLRQTVTFAPNAPELLRFLKGEELAAPSGAKGYVGVAVADVITGFGKCAGGRLKNKYPKGLRNF